MRLFINGDDRKFEGPLSLADLINQLGMKGDRVAVELNREIVARAEWEKTDLKDDDILEIVHFVGGGSGGRSADGLAWIIHGHPKA
jgi:thiamine biosynthesis protein ThiS